MTQQINSALLVARIFLALLFIIAGLGKLGNVEGFAGFMASGGIPAILAWPVILFEILGGLAILVGFMTRPVALALGAFCLVSGLLYHFDPSDQNQMTNFLKNVALTGGYIALAIAGAGKFSLDGRKG
ncbi:DoxX family protein [Lentibacter sp.]|uniref:DoxX family protein n=1 Tax=Lentibacter sp. TaxID=2024994 RepID=UPI003F6A3AFB